MFRFYRLPTDDEPYGVEGFWQPDWMRPDYEELAQHTPQSVLQTEGTCRFCGSNDCHLRLVAINFTMIDEVACEEHRDLFWRWAREFYIEADRAPHVLIRDYPEHVKALRFTSYDQGD